jgi:hypothetical protein
MAKDYNRVTFWCYFSSTESLEANVPVILCPCVCVYVYTVKIKCLRLIKGNDNIRIWKRACC